MSINKIAQAVPGLKPTSRTGGGAPAKPTGGVKPTGGARPAGGRPSRGQPTELEQSVIRMQRMMQALSTAFDKDSERIADISGVEETDIQSYSKQFSSIGYGGRKGALDGIWGSNTRQSLQAINDYIQSLNRKIEDDFKKRVEPGEGTVPYRTEKPEALIKKADQNVKVIVELMNTIGAGKNIPSGIGGARVNLDPFVPDALTSTNWDIESQDTIPAVTLTNQDLSDIQNFYTFVLSRTIMSLPETGVK